MTVIYIEEKDKQPEDIVRGRGATKVHNKFHQKMLDEKDRLRQECNYSSLHGNKEKQKIQLKLLQFIHSHGGRVLERSESDPSTYIVVPQPKALALMGCKLRENRKAIKRNDSFDIVMKMVDDMMEDFEEMDGDANEPVVIDFNGK